MFERRRLLRATVAVGTLGTATLPSWPTRAAGGPGARGDDALPAAARDALRSDGVVLLMRHAQTEAGIGDPPGFRLDACGTQRNLSAAGRAQAQRLGAWLAQAGVEVGEVRSSRWCRCLDTARLAFGRVQPWPPLDSFFADRGRADAQTDAVRRWLLAASGPGVLVGVTHQVNLTALTGEWLAMGEAWVMRPIDGAPRIAARFTVPA